MSRDDEFAAAHAAFEDWCSKKRKSDRTLSFADCHDTAQAWVKFQNCYLGHQNQLHRAPLPSAIVIRPNFGGAA